jgi:hypothetical protein
MSTAPPGDSILPYAAFADVYEALAFANCQVSLVDAVLDISWSLYGIVEE